MTREEKCYIALLVSISTLCALVIATGAQFYELMILSASESMADSALLLGLVAACVVNYEIVGAVLKKLKHPSPALASTLNYQTF